MKFKNFFKNNGFWKYLKNTTKLKRALNEKNARTLTRQEIKNIGSEFPKKFFHQYKLKLIAKIIKNTPLTKENNIELKNLAYNFNFGWNKKTKILIKEHWQKYRTISGPLEPIECEVSLLKGEVAYLQLGKGFFTDKKHLLQIQFKKYQSLILTNKRIILVIGSYKNSYYFASSTLAHLWKYVVIKDENKKRDDLYLKVEDSEKFWLYIKKFLKEGIVK